MSATPKKKRKIGRPKKNEAWRLKRFVEGTAKAVENEQLTRERDEARERADDILSEWHDHEGSYYANDKDRFPPLWENRPLTQDEIDEMRAGH